MQKVEVVQCRDTKVIPEYRDKHYQERLQSLNLYSMEYRRKRRDTIQAYTILKTIDRIDHSKFFTETKYKGSTALIYSNLDLILSWENLDLVKGS